MNLCCRKLRSSKRLGVVLWALLCLSVRWSPAESPEETKIVSGVAAVFRAGGKLDALVLPSFAHFQATGEAPTPFLPAGPYELELSSFVTMELRQQTIFQAELRGSMALEVNGRAVLQVEGRGGLSAVSPPVRLNKGTNALVVRFTPPPAGEAQLRLLWAAKDGTPQPIPEAVLSAKSSAEIGKGEQRREGRMLFAEFRCASCHDTVAGGMPELGMDAPSFADIGTRLDESWMAAWIEKPATLRPGARMPKLLSAENAPEEARAIAAYLASLKTSALPPTPNVPGTADRGKHLFEDLHCGACHFPPGDSGAGDLRKIDLSEVGAKFRPGALASYLANPQAHYRWNPMPNFHLSAAEASDLAAFLQDGLAVAPNSANEASRALGKSLVRERGCVNCHAPTERIESFAKPVAALAKSSHQAGCLAPEVSIGRAPVFPLSERQRSALREFIANGLESLGRDTPREFALRQSERLNCRACHGQFESIPPFEMLGRKLKADWSARFIAGEIKQKPRPWLEARMPAFPAAASGLAQGLAALHGYGKDATEATSVDAKLAEIGRKLVSAQGGFSCVACHAVGEKNAAPVAEGAGINFSWSVPRLRPAYFCQWVLNPQALDARTKMPVYFDETGRSPLADILDGDGTKQIEAIWEYLRSEAAVVSPR